jgi:hypothetical protein
MITRVPGHCVVTFATSASNKGRASGILEKKAFTFSSI